MGQHTSIHWAHHTFNPWRGCTKVSAGCANCYAERLSGRNPGVLGVWGPQGTRVVASESAWREPLKWNRAAAQVGERYRVFCASLADVFEGPETMPAAEVPAVNEARARLFGLIQDTPHLDWLLLTKRPQNFNLVLRAALDTGKLRISDTKRGMRHWSVVDWLHGRAIPPNVWLGASVENQKTADERIPHLLRVPAKVRFLSVEPLLRPMDLANKFGFFQCSNCFTSCYAWDGRSRCCDGEAIPFIHWVIVGGESGPGARPCLLRWVRSIVQQCKTAGVPCFVKQLGGQAIGDYYDDREEYEARGVEWPDPIGWNMRDGQPPIGSRVVLPIGDPKGGDPDEWPEDVRVREVPA